MSRSAVTARALAIFLSAAVMLYCPGCAVSKQLSYEQIAQRILATYQEALPELPLEQQKHFCLRMYRLTGDSIWLPPVIADLLNVIAILQLDRDSLMHQDYHRRRIDSLYTEFSRETRKSRARGQLFQGNEEMRLQLDWLYKLATVADYRLSDTAVSHLCREIRERLSASRIVEFLLSSPTIVVYAAQAANSIENLRQLELADTSDEFTRRFLEVFPDSVDRQLDDNQYGDKIYGLTHIVISASGYYQHTLDRRTYAWVLDYFSDNRKRILNRLSVDIIAEVGLCFLLCGDTTNAMVDLCRRKVAQRFDAKAGLIPSPLGSHDVLVGEHRNILAYMLFMWRGRRSAGPAIKVSF